MSTTEDLSRVRKEVLELLQSFVRTPVVNSEDLRKTITKELVKYIKAKTDFFEKPEFRIDVDPVHCKMIVTPLNTIARHVLLQGEYFTFKNITFDYTAGGPS